MPLPRDLRPRLQDILDNIDIVTNAVAGRDFASFVGDPILRFAIEIVSEAARHIPQGERGKHPQIPWRNIIAIGNKLRHEYQRINPDIIWDIAQTHLGDLRPSIEAMIAELTDGRC